MAFFNEGLSAEITRFGEATNSGNVRPTKNFMRNGNMDIWQRQVTFTGSSTSGYTADRWKAFAYGGTPNTISRQATGLAGSAFCLRNGRNNGSSLVAEIGVTQALPNIDAAELIGKTVSVSFMARKGADYSASGSAMTVALGVGNGTNLSGQGSGFATIATPLSASATLTTSWQRFTFDAIPISASGTQIEFYIRYAPSGSATTANDYFEITQVMISLGSKAAPFEPFGGSYGADFAECLRFYEKSYDEGYYAGQAQGNGALQSGCMANSYLISSPCWEFKALKRRAPTCTIYSSNNGTIGTISERDGGGTLIGDKAASVAGFLNRANWSGNASLTGNTLYFVTANIVADAEL